MPQRATRLWLIVYGLVDIVGMGSFGFIVLLGITGVGIALGVGTVLSVAALAFLVSRSNSVRVNLEMDTVVVRNRWFTHRIDIKDIEAVDFSNLGLGSGPPMVNVKTRRRLSGIYPLRRINLEATATYDVDAVNSARALVERWLQ